MQGRERGDGADTALEPGAGDDSAEEKPGRRGLFDGGRRACPRQHKHRDTDQHHGAGRRAVKEDSGQRAGDGEEEEPRPPTTADVEPDSWRASAGPSEP